jgi:hypothetical protein
LTVITSVVRPLKSCRGVKVAPASAAFTAAWLPRNVTLPVPSPLWLISPAVVDSLNVPLLAAIVTFIELSEDSAKSTSDTAIRVLLPAEKTTGTSSTTTISVAWVGAGAVITGSSLIGLTTIGTTAETGTPLGSFPVRP